MDYLLNMIQPSQDEDRDVDDMSLDERLELHLQLTNNKEFICQDINNVLDINQDITDIINPNILTDLEIFEDNDNTDTNAVFGRLNCSESLFGESYLTEMLRKPIRNIKVLKQRQQIVKKMLEHHELNLLLKSSLVNFANIEANIMWFWKSNEDYDEGLNELVYFNFPYMDFLNNFLNKNADIMFYSNWYKIIINPISTILSPLASVLIPLVIMKFTRSNVSTETFFSALKDSLFSTRKFQMMFGDNMIAKGAAVLSAGIWLLLYFQTSYSSVKSSKSTYNFMKTLHQKVNMLTTILDNVENIDRMMNENCDEAYIELGETVDITKMRSDLTELKELFNNRTCRTESCLRDNKGIILSAYHNFMDDKNRLLLLLKYIGKIDAFFSIAKLIERQSSSSNKYCFVDFNNSKKPYLSLEGAWHPFLVDEPILNDIEMGKDNNRSTLITGPNAAGKSTFIKTLIMNVCLSQTLGIAAANKMTITPFKLIDTYLHIPDCKGRDSLFEAEMHRCKKYINIIKNMKNDEFAFVIMDEMFSSTNYVEGYSAAYAILNKLSSYNNSLSLITTHYTKLGKLEEATNGNIKNYNFYIDRDDDDNIVYPYKIRKGVSDQFIALELLKNNNFDGDIIKEAMNEACKENKIYDECSDKAQIDDVINNDTVKNKLNKKSKTKTKTKSKKYKISD